VARRVHLKADAAGARGQHHPAELERDRRGEPPRRDANVLARTLRVLHQQAVLGAEIAHVPVAAGGEDLPGHSRHGRVGKDDAHGAFLDAATELGDLAGRQLKGAGRPLTDGRNVHQQ
jgi:hypothetical protein